MFALKNSANLSNSFDSSAQVGKNDFGLFPVKWLAMLNKCFKSFSDSAIIKQLTINT